MIDRWFAGSRWARTCRVLLGALVGLAWASGLRGFMAEVAGYSEVSWTGTFAQVLLPGTVCGALLGWAEHRRVTGRRRGRRWLVLAPLAFVVVLLVDPTAVAGLLSDGLGGGAIAVPVMAICGGYALCGAGPPAARLGAGLVPLIGLVGWGVAGSLIDPGLAIGTPRGAWVAAYFWSLLLTFSVAAGIPHRAVSTPAPDTSRRTSDDAPQHGNLVG